MSISRWRDILEAVGITAVVVSLIFLGLELRQSNTLAKAQAFQARSDAIWDMSLRLAESESLMRIAVKLDHGNVQGEYDRKAVESLSEQEWLTWRHFLSAHLFRMSTLAYQSEIGYFESDYGPLRGAVSYFVPKWKQFNIAIRDEALL